MNHSVSVIIPIYNAECYLRRCLDSVISQNYQNLEIILIDDGSTDKSRDICLEYKSNDRRIRYIYQDNKGLGHTRNIGIEAANADYITFLDSDDSLEPSFVAEISSLMRKSNADIGLCDINYIDTTTLARHISKIRFSANIISVPSNLNALNKARIFSWGKIYKKKLFADIRFPTIIFEDIAVIPIIIAKSNTIAYVSKPLCNYYRNRRESLSENPKNIGDIGKALKLLYEHCQLFGLYSTYKLEFKKLLLGQIRFAYRRFYNDTCSESVKTALQSLVSFAERLYPELSGYSLKKYYACDELLINALDKVVVFKEQIVFDAAGADLIVVYKNTRFSANLKPAIVLDVPDKPLNADESTIYGLAEEIMAKL